ncbi:hypothetical protein HanXRQr2_Chr13g0578011 [Helianthus annuus]|uniref:Uncharacterized protein n=1 Tax=Helianthus annuus TaxID=4232 RepID=A0A9K3HBM3_HELAN|nr:hypothetical protein HanXRQr2_Chr13g0578011 [Helianthus annuus]KAJ0848355.1 hypothetical protein HanPSC8_Chr13g0556281 [Helianthus annuus]
MHGLQSHLHPTQYLLQQAFAPCRHTILMPLGITQSSKHLKLKVTSRSCKASLGHSFKKKLSCPM